jgi:hypothetical protein
MRRRISALSIVVLAGIFLVSFPYSAHGWDLHGTCWCAACTEYVYIDGSLVNGVGCSAVDLYLGNYSGCHEVGVYKECGGIVSAITCSDVNARPGAKVVAYLDTCTSGRVTVDGIVQPPGACDGGCGQLTTTTIITTTVTTTVTTTATTTVSTTTTSVDGCLIKVGDCCMSASAATLGEERYREATEAIRQFRDRVLFKNPTGITLTFLYYGHSRQLTDIIEANPELKLRLAALIDKNAENIQEAVDSGTISVSSEDIDEGSAILKSIEEEASPILKVLLRVTRNRIENTQRFFESLGLKCEELE